MPTYTLFVGGIGPKASLAEIEAEFMTFGRCICSFKGNFGFVEFEDRKQAKDAMLHIHGMKFSGERLGVDWKKKKTGGPEGDAWGPERRRAGGGTVRPIASEYYRRSNRDRDRDRSRDRGSYRSHRDRDPRDGREADRRRGGGFRSRSRERDRERYDRERRSRSWDRGGKDWDRYPSRSRGRDRDGMGARRKNDRDGGYRSRSRSRSRSRDRRRHESVQSRRTEYRGDYRTREKGKSPGRREIRSDERRDRRAERDGSGGSSGHRSPAGDERSAETTGVVSQERRDTRERGSGSQREGFEDDVTRRNRKRKSRSGSGSGILNGDGRPSGEPSQGVHGHQGKNGGVDEARVQGEGGDADEGDNVARINNMAMPKTSSNEGDEPRDDSEVALHTDHSEALHTGSENDDDQDEDDERRMTAEAMESMTLSELRKELKLRNLNFSGKRPALTKRLLAATDP